jgi:hypothetical protein
MTFSPALNHLREAAAQVRGLAGARAEQSLYGPFGNFLIDAASALGHTNLLVVHQVAGGQLVPDYGIFRGDDHVGWVELKAPEKDLDTLTGHDRRQFKRALDELEVFVHTNGWQWRFYEEGSLVREVSLPREALSDPSLKIDGPLVGNLADLLERCFSHRATSVSTAEEASQVLAKRARSLRLEVRGALSHQNALLEELFQEFRQLVYASGRTYSADDFSDAYAQTAAFGLLLSRLESGADLTVATATAGIDANRHPFLWRCLSLFTDQALPADLQVVLQETVTAVNRVPPGVFAPAGGRDPLLYAYETFFAAYDPDERAARGVYYTPPPVVRHQISGIEALLERAFSIEHLLRPEIRYLDPATGTGTYLLTLLERTLGVAGERGLPADVEVAHLVRGRVRAFELMVGPYTVAHQRVSAFLDSSGVQFDERLPIYLVDSLAETLGGEVQSRFGALGQQLAEERLAAEHVKTSEPVLVILGNPPYDRIRRDQLGDHWLLERIEDIRSRTPARDRINLKALYDYYVAFWRWSLWLMGERNLAGVENRGIIAFITNRSWIIGRGFSGMRSLFSEWCRELWVLDLGGDYRAGRMSLHDNNVFDIRVGVEIVLAILDPQRPGMPSVRYRRIWGRRADKEAALDLPFDADDYVDVERESPTDPFVPIDWGPAADAPGIEEFFTQHETGVQTSRDALLVGLTASDVLTYDGRPTGGTLGDWWQLTEEEREETFNPTRTHPFAPKAEPDPRFVREYAYRPLDYRMVYNDPDFVEWPRPTLQRSFARPNIALVTIERGFGAGPAAFPVTALPDLHVFRGRGSRGIYPLWGLPRTRQRSQLALEDADWVPNFSPAVLEWASDVLGSSDADDIFAYVAALLGAPSYTTRFEAGLIAERPRIPLTQDPDLAREAVVLGRSWVQHWSLASEPPAPVRWLAQRATAPTFGDATWLPPDSLNVAGRTLAGVTEEIFEFEVSGYPVLARYLRDRKDSPADAARLEQLRRVVGALALIVETGPLLDDLLDRILSNPMRAVT